MNREDWVGYRGACPHLQVVRCRYPFASWFFYESVLSCFHKIFSHWRCIGYPEARLQYDEWKIVITSPDVPRGRPTLRMKIPNYIVVQSSFERGANSSIANSHIINNHWLGQTQSLVYYNVSSLGGELNTANSEMQIFSSSRNLAAVFFQNLQNFGWLDSFFVCDCRYKDLELMFRLSFFRYYCDLEGIQFFVHTCHDNGCSGLFSVQFLLKTWVREYECQKHFQVIF